MSEKKKSNHYIDNKKFFEEMCKWLEEYNNAIKNNLPKPEPSQFIGESISLIAERLAMKPNFSGYTYKDEMIADAILNCITYLHNFNPEKTQNPFSYFTQFCYYSFIRTIKAEKKQAYVKYKMIEKMNEKGSFEEWVKKNNYDMDGGEQLSRYLHLSSDEINSFESKNKTPK